MNIRKLSLFFSLILLMFCSFGISAAAAEVRELIVYDMDYKVTGLVGGKETDITSSCVRYLETHNDVECVRFVLPSKPDSYGSRIIYTYDITDLNSTSEYNVNFKFCSSSSVTSTMIAHIYYKNSAGTVIKEQPLYSVMSNSSDWQEVDFDFRPDVSDISEGYKAELTFGFFSVEEASFSYRISNVITLTDKNDVSGDLGRILNAILTLDTNIDGYLARFETGVIQKLNTLDSHIDTYFDELGGQLVSAITTLDTHIDGYFDLLLNGIIANDNALSDKLHEYLDKFKPRFYEVLSWRYGLFDVVDWIIDWDNSSAVLSEDFFVPNGTEYYVTLTKPAFLEDRVWYDNFQFSIVRFSSEGEHEIVLSVLAEELTEPFLLEPGYYYQFELMEFYNGDFEVTFPDIDLSDACNSIVRVYADEGWLTAFRNSIVQGFYDIMNPGVYEEPTSNAWEDSKDKFDKIESELPTFDASDMAEVDISDYAGAFGCVRYLFDRFLSVSGLTTLLTFSLVFGLGVFLIGRKVGG